MSDKKIIDKQYLLQTLRNFEKIILSKKYEKIGNSLPIGGTTGQVLTKASDNDKDVKWATYNGGSGEAGKSAYDIAVDNGFEGTESEWLKSLQGEDGKSIQSIEKDENNNIIVTFSNGDTQSIGKLSIDVQANFLTSDGFGNLRYYNSCFQYYDKENENWVNTTITPETVAFVANTYPQSVKKITAKYNKKIGRFEINIEEPNDTLIEEQLFCAIEKVVLVRKEGAEPSSISDGTTILEIERKDFGAYKVNSFTDNSLVPTMGIQYYYKAFPVSTAGTVNTLTENSTNIIAKPSTIYGFKIDQNESNPANMITYLPDCDNANFMPAYMDYDKGVFNYGDWEDAWFISKLKPCMLKYDGTVEYELNPNDYSKKIDGIDSSDIANIKHEGNVMVGIPKIYWKIVDNGNNTSNVYFSDQKQDDDYKCWSHIDNNGNEIDYCYVACYDGYFDNTRQRSLSGFSPTSGTTRQQEANRCQANNIVDDKIWYTNVFCDYQLINLLLLLIGKNANIQEVFGYGNNNSGRDSVKASGLLNNKGLFFGFNDNVSPVKVFGIENYYGNLFKACAGWIYDCGTQKIKMTYGQSDGSSIDGYNMTGDGYIAIPNSLIVGNTGSYITKMIFTEHGLIPKQTNGSATTFYTDALYFDNEQVNYALVGGRSNFGKYVGAFCFGLYYTYLGTGWDFGSSLSCKPLAQTQAGGET